MSTQFVIGVSVRVEKDRLDVPDDAGEPTPSVPTATKRTASVACTRRTRPTGRRSRTTWPSRRVREWICPRRSRRGAPGSSGKSAAAAALIVTCLSGARAFTVRTECRRRGSAGKVTDLGVEPDGML